MLNKDVLAEKIKILEENSRLVHNYEDKPDFRLNFNEYSEKEIKGLGFRTADGCVFVHAHGVSGVDYNSDGMQEIDYKVTNKETVQLLLAYAETKDIPISKTLAEKVGYEIGAFAKKTARDSFRSFANDDEAIAYAEKSIGKYEAEIVLVDGKKTLLSATGLPLENRFREPIEKAVLDFLKEMGMDEDDNDALDIMNYIGAQMEGELEELIEGNSKFRILSAYQEY